MNKQIKKLENEVDVVSFIGYNTPMKFYFTSEGTFTFKTVVPSDSEEGIFFYEVEFFYNEKDNPTFFSYDSFSNFLLKYRIHTVNRINQVTQQRTEIYYKTYE